ncbi:ATP-NAD kinase [Testicularia cyperi]|uniref:ATP-NAD kinase n=1 Tax=Testicularia cyperi TaxID=1882483 RepID=A0A317XJX3_9BASI|nr:ATP-NAD kinase [Testicularia cyperi]
MAQSWRTSSTSLRLLTQSRPRSLGFPRSTSTATSTLTAVRTAAAPLQSRPPTQWTSSTWHASYLQTAHERVRRSASCRNLHSSSSDASRSGSRQTLRELPDKVDVCIGPAGRLSKVVSPRRGNKITTRVGSSYAGNHTFSWIDPPSNVLLVKKARDDRATKAMCRIIKHIRATYPHMNIILEKAVVDADEGGLATRYPELIAADPSEKAALAAKTDFVITLGGDGSILHVSSLFDRDAVPPVLSFSMGTLGFLLPYDISSFKEAIRDLIDGNITLLLRMRLRQTSHRGDGVAFCQLQDQTDDGGCYDIHLMNEVTLHRGREPHMTKIDAYVDGQHLTQAISDGLIIATPTGSTAYSLSAGGPIVHPSVQSLVLTPICPRSLSFRTVLLPSDSVIQLKISEDSRSPAELTVDGRISKLLQPGEYLQVSMSPYPIPCVSRHRSSNESEPETGSNLPPGLLASISPVESSAHPSTNVHSLTAAGPGEKFSERGEDDWVRDINTLLKFNATFGGRGTLSGNGGFEEDED